MSLENGDRAALHNARLIASIAAFQGYRSLVEIESQLYTPMNNPGVDEKRIDGTLLHSNVPHLSTLPHVPRGLFSDAYLLFPTLNPLPTYANVPIPRPSVHVPCPFYQNDRASKRRTLFGTVETTLLQGWTAFPSAHTPYLHASSAFFPAKWIRERTSQIHF